MVRSMIPLLLLGSLGCTGDFTGGDSAGTTASDSGSTVGTADSGTTSGEVGCLSGRLRDANNGSGDGLVIDAWEPVLCAPLGSTTTAADGTFCLQGLPVGTPVLLQATFDERCPWAHGKSVTIPLSGTCETGGCAELETWYECQGESASCP